MYEARSCHAAKSPPLLNWRQERGLKNQVLWEVYEENEWIWATNREDRTTVTFVYSAQIY
jgi:hypothetical protein